jgi:hypothetical protein
MTETWYLMEDGTVGDPHEVAPDKDGVLRHKDGRAVAMASHGPRSRGVDADAERAKARAKVAPKPAEAVEKPVAPEPPEPATRRTRDMKPEEPATPYKTR